MTSVERPARGSRTASPGGATRRAIAGRGKWPRTRVILLGVIGLLAFGVLATWLLQPSPKAAFEVSARTATITIEPLCGERLVWDLPPGRIVRRSSMPGSGEPAREASSHVTVVLLAGARARLESAGGGKLGMVLGRADSISRACGTEGHSFYQVSADDTAVPDDPIGVSYATVRPGDAPQSEVSLVLSGHVLIGDTVRQGAGWQAQQAMLESGTVELRVVPWFGDDRVTLRTESLEEGSLFDTHACLANAAGDAPSGCPSAGAPPALGFLRTVSSGGMNVQLYVRGGAVGTQSFGGDQRVMRISESTAAWHSPTLSAITSLVLILFAIYSGVKTLVKDGLEWWDGHPAGPTSHDEPDEAADEASHLAVERTREPEKSERDTRATVRPKTGITMVAVVVVLTAASAAAEPVEIHQGSYIGAGYSFKHGTSCLVVTARHVVPEMGSAVTVLDRGGAAAQGSRSYDNESYDLALIALPEKSPVACTSAWPDSTWIARASFSGPGEFHVVRHYPNGRETIVRLQYAGGIRQSLTLGFVDRLRVRESDSGALVEFGGKPVGIVQSVDTATDRVNVLKFDAIDQLVGDRFRSRTNAPVGYAGVFQRGRQNPEWSTYIQSWITDKARRPVVVIEPPSPGRPDPRRPVTTPARGGPKPLCEIKVDVMSWERLPVPNPDYSKVELGMKACGKRGFFFEQSCAAARSAARTTPRQLMSQKVTFQASVTPGDSPAFEKLETSTVIPPANATLGRTELELAVLQEAVGPTLKTLLDAAPCQ